jgi:hypothetical protein
MHSMFTRSSRALLLVAATLAVSAAATESALGAPPPRDDALEEAAAARKPPVPLFQDPDVAIQIRALAPCEAFDPEKLRKDLARHPRDAEVRAIFNERAAREGLPPLDPDQEVLAPRDVRATCAAGNLRIAVYLDRVRDELSDARDRGLARVNLTAAGTLDSAIRVHPRLSELLEHRTDARLFEIEKEKPSLRFVHFGPKGPQVRFVAPDKVVTTIKGKDTRPLPDVSFTTTITDTLSVQGGAFRCTTRTHTNANTRVHKGLLAAGMLTAPANFGVAAAGFGAQLALIEREIAAENRKPGERGPGCQMLLGEEKAGGGGDGPVFPPEVSAAAGTFGFDYARAGVEDGGLVARFAIARR